MSPALMTVAMAESLGYSLKHQHCGGNDSIIRMGRFDGSVLQFIDVQADPVPEKSAS